MQVIAVSTPVSPDWRWRIVNYAGELVEESRETFPTIAAAVAGGARRLSQLDVPDPPLSPTPYRSAWYPRAR